MEKIIRFGDWEIISRDITDFKEDDIVVNINKYDDFFGKIGILTQPLITTTGKVKSFKIIFSDNSISYSDCTDLRLASPDEIEQYELETNAKKYNL